MKSVLTNHDVTNSIWNGDCLKLLPTLPNNSADFILTDPPYITSYRSRDGRSVPNDNNDAWLRIPPLPSYTVSSSQIVSR